MEKQVTESVVSNYSQTWLSHHFGDLQGQVDDGEAFVVLPMLGQLVVEQVHEVDQISMGQSVTLRMVGRGPTFQQF